MYSQNIDLYYLKIYTFFYPLDKYVLFFNFSGCVEDFFSIIHSFNNYKSYLMTTLKMSVFHTKNT